MHTELDAASVGAFLEILDLDPLEALEGVPQGSIHTTYRVRARGRTYYLRLTEGLGEDEVAFELALLRHLAARGFPAPHPVERPGVPLPGRLAGRPAVLFEEIPGAPVAGRDPTPEEVAEVGAILARLHEDATGLVPTRANPYGPEVVAGWLRSLVEAPPAGLDAEVSAALPGLVRTLEACRGFGEGLGAEAVGPIHADLFTDNVHFEDGRLAGVLDLEMACTAPRILDLAIALHVWAWTGEAFDPERARALMAAYTRRRELSPAEAGALFDAARFAAVRYTVSRIRDFHLSSLPADRLVHKDWRAFARRLAALERLGPGGLASLVAHPSTPAP